MTERIRLATDILILPLRTNTALFAKQSATIDALSGGRLVLGLAVGGRQDDYELSKAPFQKRGATFDDQLTELTELWAGDVVGPTPANRKRPTLLIGGQSDKAFQRAAKYADGWTMGGGGPDAFAAAHDKVKAAWSEAGREGEPRTSALFYFALGPYAEDVAARSLGDYYAFLGDYAQQIVQSAAKDAATLKGYVSAFEQAGVAEIIAFPASSDPAQVDLLAGAVL